MLPLLLCLLATADTAPERTHTPTLDDYYTLVTPTEIALSPDGTQLAYVQAAWAADKDGRVNTLRVAEVATGKVRVLLDGKPSPHGLRWTKDGATLLFLGNVEKRGSQVWQISTAGGPAKPITDLDGGVRAFDLSPDEKALYALSDAPLVDPTFAELRKEFAKLEYGTGGKKRTALWRLDRASGKGEKLLDQPFYLHELAASPDGKRIALIVAPDDSVAAFEGRSYVGLFDLASKQVRRVPDEAIRKASASKYPWLEKLAWSPSGKALAYGVIHDAFPCEVVLVEGEGDAVTVRKLPRPMQDDNPSCEVHVRGYGSPLEWRSESELVLLADLRGRTAAMAADTKSGKWARLTPGDVAVGAFSLAGKKAAYVLGTPSAFPDLYVQDGAGEAKPLPTLNPQVAKWKLPTLKVVRWKGHGGVDVEGILEIPAGRKDGEKVPLVVAIHGGPSTCSTVGLIWSLNGGLYLSSKGYAVLYPNYRGSTGYGDAFLLGLNGKENEADVGDILAGAEAMVKDGVADPDRMAIMGWSNGGYLTNCAITKTTRFKAAISGAGIIDHVIEWGLSDEPAYPMVFKKDQTPWQAPEVYRASSPVWGLGNVKTPTLLHVGSNDERCPPGHSKLVYRALKDYLDVPTELIVYPGEPHGLQKGKNRKAKFAWDLAWLEKWLR